MKPHGQASVDVQLSEALPDGTITVLITDIEGSTDLLTRRGDDAARVIFRAHDEIVRERVIKHRGREVKGLGDGYLVVFTSARRAVQCASEIQRALEHHNRANPTEPIRVRMGLNAGEVVADQADLFGAAVNAAARIAAKAKGGEILVADVVKQLAGNSPGVAFVDRGRTNLKGFPDRWRLHEVVWTAPAPLQPSLDRTPYAGRSDERADLGRYLERALAGHGEMVLIAGEPGGGKTRLTEEIAALGEERGMRTLVGRCHDMEGTAPYIPFAEIFDTVLSQPGSQEVVRKALGEDAGEVARIIPSLRRVFPDIPPPLALAPEQERHHVFNCVRQFVLRTAELNPLLLVLDDLHWADEPTLLLVEHLAERVSEAPILLIGTHRDIDVKPGSPLARTLEGLLRRHLAHRISLKPLPEDGVASMLRSLSQQDPPAGLVRAIFEETEGNPFFVEAVFQHLSEDGQLFDPDGRFRTDLRIDELDVPEGVRLVIGRRLERLSEPCRKVLLAAAVIGRSFAFSLLEALGEVPLDDLLDAHDEAEVAGLVAPMPNGREARYMFAHELIRQTLISSVSMPRRQRLHLRVAQSMQQIFAAAPEEHASEIAHHYFQAGAAADPATTAHYLVLAGESALAAAAFEDALDNFQRAASLDLPANRARADLYRRLGLAQRSVGRWADALSSWETAVPIYESIGERQAAARMFRMASTQLMWGRRWTEALEAAHRGLAAAGEEPSFERCRLLAGTGSILSQSGDHDGGAQLISQATAMATELGDGKLAGYAANADALHHFCYMDAERCISISLDAAKWLHESGDRWGEANLLSFAAGASLQLGRYADHDELSRELRPLATRQGNFGVLLFLDRTQAAIDLEVSGDVDRWCEFAAADLRLCRSVGSHLVSDAHTFIGLGEFWRGNWDAALASFQEGADTEAPGSLGGNWVFVAVCAAYLSETERAQALLDGRLDLLPRPGNPSSRHSWTYLLGMVESLHVAGERERAGALYPTVVEALASGEVCRYFDHRLLQTLAGIAAAGGSRWEAAEEHFRAAIRLAETLPAQLELADARRFYAEALLARGGEGDGATATELLSAALADYKRFGMKRHQAMADSLRSRSG